MVRSVDPHHTGNGGSKHERQKIGIPAPGRHHDYSHADRHCPSGSPPTPQELAAARLQSEGLMKGDENGELHLEDDLTRAELACLISPIILNPEHVAWETEWYTRMCTTNFNDVPEWAQVAVGVCASMGTMAGYGDGLFGPSDPVSPQMACTVMLRYLEQDGWTYDTACEKAAELGLAPAGSLEGDAITRGDMAILLTGSLDYLAYLQTL